MKKNGRTYEDMTHIYGRIWILCALGMIFAYPIVTCIYYQAWPGWKPVLKGLLGVAPIFWTVGLIEVVTFVPMLGTAGSYLAFVNCSCHQTMTAVISSSDVAIHFPSF